MNMEIIPIVGMLSLFVGLPGVVMFFAYKIKKDKNDVKRLQYKRDLSELELRKQEARIRELEAENSKYDRIIDSK